MPLPSNNNNNWNRSSTRNPFQQEQQQQQGMPRNTTTINSSTLSTPSSLEDAMLGDEPFAIVPPLSPQRSQLYPRVQASTTTANTTTTTANTAFVNRLLQQRQQQQPSSKPSILPRSVNTRRGGQPRNAKGSAETTITTRWKELLQESPTAAFAGLALSTTSTTSASSSTGNRRAMNNSQQSSSSNTVASQMDQVLVAPGSPQTEGYIQQIGQVMNRPITDNNTMATTNTTSVPASPYRTRRVVAAETASLQGTPSKALASDRAAMTTPPPNNLNVMELRDGKTIPSASRPTVARWTREMSVPVAPPNFSKQLGSPVVRARREQTAEPVVEQATPPLQQGTVLEWQDPTMEQPVGALSPIRRSARIRERFLHDALHRSTELGMEPLEEDNDDDELQVTPVTRRRTSNMYAHQMGGSRSPSFQEQDRRMAETLSAFSQRYFGGAWDGVMVALLFLWARVLWPFRFAIRIARRFYMGTVRIVESIDSTGLLMTALTGIVAVLVVSTVFRAVGWDFSSFGRTEPLLETVPPTSATMVPPSTTTTVPPLANDEFGKRLVAMEQQIHRLSSAVDAQSQQSSAQSPSISEEIQQQFDALEQRLGLEAAQLAKQYSQSSELSAEHLRLLQEQEVKLKSLSESVQALSDALALVRYHEEQQQKAAAAGGPVTDVVDYETLAQHILQQSGYSKDDALALVQQLVQGGRHAGMSEEEVETLVERRTEELRKEYLAAVHQVASSNHEYMRGDDAQSNATAVLRVPLHRMWKNFALARSGAQILRIPGLTSTTYHDEYMLRPENMVLPVQSNAPWMTLISWFKNIRVPKFPPNSSPVDRLLHTDEDRFMWNAARKQGQANAAVVTMLLSRAVHIDNVTYEHASPQSVPEYACAPKIVDVWGMSLSESAKEYLERSSRRVMQLKPLLQSIGKAMSGGPAEDRLDPTLPYTPMLRRHLGQFEYKAGEEYPSAQTFPLAGGRQGLPVDVLMLVVRENGGNPKYTCMNRVYVHGEEPQWEEHQQEALRKLSVENEKRVTADGNVMEFKDTKQHHQDTEGSIPTATWKEVALRVVRWMWNFVKRLVADVRALQMTAQWKMEDTKLAVGVAMRLAGLLVAGWFVLWMLSLVRSMGRWAWKGLGSS